MIYAVKVKCTECYRNSVLLLTEGDKIKEPYLCPDCFMKKSKNNMEIENIEIGVGGSETYGCDFLMGYEKNKELYKPIVRMVKK